MALLAIGRRVGQGARLGWRCCSSSLPGPDGGNGMSDARIIIAVILALLLEWLQCGFKDFEAFVQSADLNEEEKSAQGQTYREKYFGYSRHEKLTGKDKWRFEKIAQVGRSIFGDRFYTDVMTGYDPTARMTPRQQAEWKRLTESIVALDTSPDAQEAKLENGPDVYACLRDPKWFEGADPPTKRRNSENDEEDGDDYEFSLDYGGRRVTPYLEHPQFDVDFAGVVFSAQPTFNEMTTPVIEGHAAELTQHFVPWTPPPSDAILQFETRQYIKINPSKRDQHREAKVVLTVNVEALGLSSDATERLVALAESRYNSETGNLRLTSGRFATSEMNREYLKQVLTALVRESLKDEPVASTA